MAITEGSGMDGLNLWLLEGPPWVQYRTRVDLLGQNENASPVVEARKDTLNHPQVQEIQDELIQWPGLPLKSHKDAKHPIHKLAFLADLGLKSSHQGMKRIIDRVLEHQSDQGPFQVMANVHPRYGGSGKDQYVWMLCDAPMVLYSLIGFGLGGDIRVKEAVDHLVSLIRENGWPCAVSPEMGKFRGPGRKTDPCPYANLVMLKLLALIPDLHEDAVVRTGAEVLLGLWTQRKERRPYLFGMGRDFSKLKAPMIWYDLLHVLDVLTRFSWLRNDDRLLEMVKVLMSKSDDQGRFTPESIWMAWKSWDFGQRREPSYWLTFLAQRILKRLNN
jgi:hypothetical protein